MHKSFSAIVASAALVASSVLGAAAAPGSSVPVPTYQPSPSTHLTDVPVGGPAWNPKAMVEAGQPTELYGYLVPTQRLEITTLQLSGLDGIGNTAVTIEYGGVTRHVNLVPDGRSTVVDFGAPLAPAYAIDGGAWVLITYSSHRVTSISTDLRAVGAVVTR